MTKRLGGHASGVGMAALLCASVGSLLCAGGPASAEPAAGEVASVSSAPSVDETIRQRMRDAGIVGVGASIIVGKELVWSAGFGYANREQGRPFTPDTVMNVGSIAKTVLGAAIMRAAEEGKLSLDEDIGRHLPFRVVNPHHPAERITLRHLATHTSGISDRREIYAGTYHYGADSPEPLERFLTGYFSPGGATYAAENFLNAKPGAMREYSNIGAGLAGLVLERATGTPLHVYTRERIFAPLGMTRTAWFLSEVDPAQHAQLYVAQNGLVIPIPNYGCTTYPDGGVRTSVADLSRFFLALLNGGAYQGARILSPESAAEMLRFQFTEANHPENFPPTAGNSGIFWRTKFNGTRVGHGGNDPGIHTEMLTDLSHDVGVVMLVNTSLSGDEQIAIAQIFDALWKHAEALRDAQRAGSTTK